MLLRSLLMSGVASQPLYAPDGVVGGAAGGAGAPAEPVGGAPAEPAAAAAAPVDTGAAGAADAGGGAPEPGAGEKAAGEAAAAAAPAADAKPARDFAPSLLDEAAKATRDLPTADAKPGDAAPAKDAAKPADAKPSDKKEPAADAAKPGDAKAADAKPAEPPAPIEYAFTYPDGIKPEDVNPERLGAFTGILNEVRANPEAGQKLLDLHLEEVSRIAQETEQRASERQWDVFANQQKDWRDKVMADDELGGARHATAIGTVMSLVDAFSLREQSGKNPRTSEAIAAERKELLDVARMTGVANNPTFLRLLHWAGEKLVKEGKPRPASPPRQGPVDPAQRGLRRYQGTTPAR